MTAPDPARGSPRLRGLRNMAIGMALFVPGLVVFFFARSWLLAHFGHQEGTRIALKIPRMLAVVIGAPMAAGYVLMMTGFYRAVFGTRGQAQSFAWSLFRIVFGLFATLTLIVCAMIVVALFEGIAHETG